MSIESTSTGMALADDGRLKQETLAWRRRHLLDVDDLSPDEIVTVLDVADAMQEVLARPIRRVPALRGVTIATLFYEASTRTRASFELAAKVLGADVVNLAAVGSSVEKGESLLDTVRTIQAMGVDLLVMRHWQSGAPYLAARHCGATVVNAGDGWHAHPTQALLDVYTIRAHLGANTAGSEDTFRGKRVVIVGDILHSRVARSNIWALTKLGAEVVLCGPPTLLPDDMRKGEAQPGAPDEKKGMGLPPAKVEISLDKALEGADVVMALRIQKERQADGLLPSIREYVSLYQVNGERFTLAKPGALLMHPGPMNEGIEVSPALARGAASVIDEQVANGVAVRMAVLYLLTGRK